MYDGQKSVPVSPIEVVKALLLYAERDSQRISHWNFADPIFERPL
jgi:hypothetical protein